MNIIGIDPSLVSTAMCINGKHLFNYTKEKYATNKSGLNKWYKTCEDYVEYRWIDYSNIDDFTDSEIDKLKSYERLADLVVKDINNYINKNEKVYIGIEGYSYSSSAGPLIDLVTYGTILRGKLLEITDNIKIYPPSTLKLEAAKLTYPKIMEGKKEVWRNNEGVAGGKFNKHDMYKALTENNSLHSDWVEFLREIKGDIFESKTIKKPVEDCNDSYLIYEVLKFHLGV
jgi:hypothetical protein